MGTLSIFFIVLIVVMSAVIYLCIKEIRKENNRINSFIETDGEVVGSIECSERIYVDPHRRVFENYQHRQRGYVLVSRYKTLDGREFQKSSQEMYIDAKNGTVKVKYNPKNPTDIVIDGFYENAFLYPYFGILLAVLIIPVCVVSFFVSDLHVLWIVFMATLFGACIIVSAFRLNFSKMIKY